MKTATPVNQVHRMLISINTKTARMALDKKEANTLTSTGWEQRQIAWQENIVRSMFRIEWMAGVVVQGEANPQKRKRKDCIQGINSLFIDIDDMTQHGDRLLDVTHQRLTEAGLLHAISTSANHMKPKTKESGEVLPPCPRLKILIPLPYEVDLIDPEAVAVWDASRESILAHIADIIGIEPSLLDKSSLDANRYSYRAPDYAEWRFNGEGQPLDIEPLAVKPKAVAAPRPMTGYENDKVLNAAEYIFSQDRDRQIWLKTCFAIANTHGVDKLRLMTRATNAELASFATRSASGQKVSGGTVIHYARLLGWDETQFNTDHTERMKTVNLSDSIASIFARTN